MGISANGHSVDVAEFRNALKAWGRQHFRSFPWRHTEDPYQVLMAEIMLHRTQATQAVLIYQRFIEAYPHAHALLGPAERSYILRSTLWAFAGA